MEKIRRVIEEYKKSENKDGKKKKGRWDKKYKEKKRGMS